MKREQKAKLHNLVREGINASDRQPLKVVNENVHADPALRNITKKFDKQQSKGVVSSSRLFMEKIQKLK